MDILLLCPLPSTALPSNNHYRKLPNQSVPLFPHPTESSTDFFLFVLPSTYSPLVDTNRCSFRKLKRIDW